MKKTDCKKNTCSLSKISGQSFRSFRRNVFFYKKSFLCLGLLISLCIAIFFTGFNVSSSYQKAAAASLFSFDKNTLFVQMEVPASSKDVFSLPNKENMQEFAAANSAYLKGIEPFLQTETKLLHNRSQISVSALGISENFPNFKNLSLAEGRFFTSFDIKDNKKFIILGSNSAEKLFPHDTPLGQKVTIQNENYTVIGALDKKETTFQNAVLLPYTAHRQIFSTPYVNQYFAFPENGKAKEAKTAIQNFLANETGDVTSFSIYTQADQMQKTNPISSPYLWILSLGTVLSVLILLICLSGYWVIYFKKRRTEWKSRLRCGAHPIQLVWQILFEGIYNGLCFMSAGLLLGLFLTFILSLLLKLPFAIHWTALFTLLPGVPILAALFCLWPGIKSLLSKY